MEVECQEAREYHGEAGRPVTKIDGDFRWPITFDDKWRGQGAGHQMTNG